MDFFRFACLVADKVDPPALGEQVEDALFSAGYIHGVSGLWSRAPEYIRGA